MMEKLTAAYLRLSQRERMMTISGGQHTVPILAENGDVVQIGWQGRCCVI